MYRVPVVDKNNIPLMPTKCSKARKLVRDKKAIGKWDKLGQYYIQLTFEPSGIVLAASQFKDYLPCSFYQFNLSTDN